MFDRLPFDQHQTARDLAAAIAPTLHMGIGTTASRTLKEMIRREHPDLGERFVCPSGQTVADFADAVAAWSR